MRSTTVRTQSEFDAAWTKHKDDYRAEILIDSPSGVWLEVTASGSATVRASGSATVRASGSATVTAYDSATVRASDSATVRASDSATVRASGSATVTASDSATVRASDSATVRAGSYVAVHLHSARVTLTGGVVLDVTALDLTDPQTWVGYTGAKVSKTRRTVDGRRTTVELVTLYKAVDADMQAGRSYIPTTYPVGQDVTASDWRDNHHCGHGLHTSPHPHQALVYYPEATRMLEVTVPLSDLRPIPGGTAKAKARTVHVVREVTLDGAELPASVTA
jgi:hypothetical protein